MNPTPSHSIAEKPLPSTPPLNTSLPLQPKLFPSLHRFASSLDLPPLATVQQSSKKSIPGSYKKHLLLLIRQALRARGMVTAGWGELILEQVLKIPLAGWIDELLAQEEATILGDEETEHKEPTISSLSSYLRRTPSFRSFVPPTPSPLSLPSTTTTPVKPQRLPLFPLTPPSDNKPLPASPRDGKTIFGVTLWLEDLGEGFVEKDITWVEGRWAVGEECKDQSETDEGTCDEDGVWRRWICVSSGIDGESDHDP